MIKAILLLVRPGPTWDRIIEAKRSLLTIFFIFALPVLLLSAAGEGYGYFHWGKQRGDFGKPIKITRDGAILCSEVNALLGGVVIFTTAAVILAISRSLRGRQTYTQAFTLAAYALSPYFAARLLNTLPFMPPWVTWAIGATLAAATLYQGVPRVLQPDPPQTLGLYFMSVLTISFVTALAQIVSTIVVDEQFQVARQILKALPKHH